MNKLANEAFGRGFFLKAAMGMASLWPAFLAAAWPGGWCKRRWAPKPHPGQGSL